MVAAIIGNNEKPDSGEPGFSVHREVSANYFDVLGQRTFGTLLDRELNALVFDQVAVETGAGDLVSMNEDVAFVTVDVDKAEAFAGIEPLHSTL